MGNAMIPLCKPGRHSWKMKHNGAVRVCRVCGHAEAQKIVDRKPKPKYL